MDKSYLMNKLYMIGALLLIVGGFNTAVALFTGKDFIASLFGRRSILTNALFFGIGLAALALAFSRDFYLPFLGQTVMPCSLLNPSTPEGADMKMNVQVRPGAKILYWAAEPANTDLKGIQDWRKAYLGFRNAGVAVADDHGVAELAVRTPQAYSVPMKGKLNAHVHYRVCGDDGMMDRVETAVLPGAGAGAAAAEGFVSNSSSDEEINAVAQRTAAQSLMAESGAIDESNVGRAGANLSEAF